MDDDEWVMLDSGCNKRKCTDVHTEQDASEVTRKPGKVRKADVRKGSDVISGQSKMQATSVLSPASSGNTLAPSKSTTWPVSDDVGVTRGQLPIHKFLSSGIRIFESQYETPVDYSDLTGIEEKRHLLHVGLKETMLSHRYATYSDKQLLRAMASEEIFDSQYLTGKGKNIGRLAPSGKANLAIFLMANHLRVRRQDMDHVYQWCNNLRVTSGLNHLRSAAGPIADSLIEQIIPTAIRKQDLDMINAVLDYGFALTDLRCCTDIDCFSHNAHCWLPPLHSACHVGSVIGVRTLLDRAADPNQLFPMPMSSSVTPMDCILRHKRKRYGEKGDVERIIQMLIEANVHDAHKAKEETLMSALRDHDFDVASRLLNAWVKPYGHNEFSHGIRAPAIFMVLKRDDGVVVQEVLSIVRQLLGAGVEVNTECNGWDIRGFYDTSEDNFSDSEDENYYTRNRWKRPDLPGTAGISEVSSDNSNSLVRDRSFASPRPPLQYAAEQWDCNVDLMRLLIVAGASVGRKLVHFFVKSGATDCLALLAETFNGELRERYKAWIFASAIRYGNLELAKQTIRSMSEVFFSDDLCNAMKKAVKKGYTQTLKWAISEIPRPRGTITLEIIHYEKISTGLGSALCASILHELHDITELLIEGGADVNGRTEGVRSYRRTPLLEAVTKGNWTLCKRLLRLGAYTDFDYVKKDDEIRYPCSVLPTAVAKAPKPFIQTLLRKGANPNTCELPDGKCALSLAIERGSKSIVRLLIDAGADINGRLTRKHQSKDVDVPLATAIRKGSHSLVNYLLELGADPCEHTLCAAVKHRNDFVAIIINARRARYGNISNRFACRALHDAISYQESDTVELLLSHGIDPSMNVIDETFGCTESYGYRASPLGHALRNARYIDEHEFESGEKGGIIKKLLRSTANLDAVIFKRPDILPTCTPLLMATNSGNTWLVNKLLEMGASINLPAAGQVKYTPLQIAAEKGDIEMIELLLEKGAEVNAAPYPRLGRTALQAAAAKGYFGIALLLLRNRADPNAAPARIGGYTALEEAAKYGRIDIIQLLLNWGAVFAMSDRNQYEVALREARENGHAAACRLVKESYIAQNKQRASDSIL